MVALLNKVSQPWENQIESIFFQAYWVSGALNTVPLNAEIEARVIEALCQTPSGK